MSETTAGPTGERASCRATSHPTTIPPTLATATTSSCGDPLNRTGDYAGRDDRRRDDRRQARDGHEHDTNFRWPRAAVQCQHWAGSGAGTEAPVG